MPGWGGKSRGPCQLEPGTPQPTDQLSTGRPDARAPGCGLRKSVRVAIDPRLDPAELAPWLRRELLAAGESDRSIARHVAAGDWHRVRWGAYIGADFWVSLSPEDQHRVRARAVLKNAHPTTVLSHVSAAIELGAPTYGIDLGIVHVTRLDGHPGRRHRDVVHHVGVLPQAAVIVRNGVRVVEGNRAAIEVATIADLEATLVTVDGLLHRGEASLEALGALAKEHDRWPHSLTTDLVLQAGRRQTRVGGRVSVPQPVLQARSSVPRAAVPDLRRARAARGTLRRCLGGVRRLRRGRRPREVHRTAEAWPVRRRRDVGPATPGGADLPAHWLGVRPDLLGRPRSPGRHRPPDPGPSREQARSRVNLPPRSCHFPTVATVAKCRSTRLSGDSDLWPPTRQPRRSCRCRHQTTTPSTTNGPKASSSVSACS